MPIPSTEWRFNRCPLLIRMVIEIYVAAERAEATLGSMWDSIAGRGCRKWLLDQELIVADTTSNCYRTTKKGDVWVRAICDTPLPIVIPTPTKVSDQ